MLLIIVARSAPGAAGVGLRAPRTRPLGVPSNAKWSAEARVTSRECRRRVLAGPLDLTPNAGHPR